MIIPVGRDLHQLDAYTINNEPLHSIQLMERAAMAFCKAWLTLNAPKREVITVFCGRGNNGGDGFAIARILSQMGYSMRVVYQEGSRSPDCEHNFQKLQSLFPDLPLSPLESNTISTGKWAIDALFGSGFSREFEAEMEATIETLNKRYTHWVAVDLPSGMGDQFIARTGIVAKHTFTFHAPKLSFFHPSEHHRVGKLQILDIGLLTEGFPYSTAHHLWVRPKDIAVPQLNPVHYKGTAGKVLLAAGSMQYPGAALLAVSGARATGAGLIYLYAPKSVIQHVVQQFPDVIGLESEMPLPTGLQFHAVLVGPGIGTERGKAYLNPLQEALKHSPVVVDADGIALYEQFPAYFQAGPARIFTPHIGEAKTLMKGDLEPSTLANWSESKESFLVVKNRFTVVYCPQGTIFYHTSGSPVLAKGGSGDVLAGLISGFLARGLGSTLSINAAICNQGITAVELDKKAVGFPRIMDYPICINASLIEGAEKANSSSTAEAT